MIDAGNIVVTWSGPQGETGKARIQIGAFLPSMPPPKCDPAVNETRVAKDKLRDLLSSGFAFISNGGTPDQYEKVSSIIYDRHGNSIGNEMIKLKLFCPFQQN